MNYYFYTNYKDCSCYEGIVSKIDDNAFYIKKGFYYIKVYSSDLSKIQIGNKIKISLDLFEINERNVENTFSYYRYKISKRIVKEGNIKEILSINDNFNIFHIKRYVIDYIDKYYSYNTSIYLKRMVLGINEFDESIDDAITNLGIIFLFCISGLHISLLSSMIKRFLRIFNLEEEVISVFLILFLLIYMIIAESSASIFRSVVITIINEILSLKRFKMAKLDSLSLSFIILLFYNPFYIFQYGFYLTFLTVSIIYLSNEKNALKGQFTLIIFSMPFLLYKTKEISIFIMGLSLIFNLLFESILIPLTYLTFVFYPLGFIYEYVVTFINNLMNVLNNLNLSFKFSIYSIYTLIIIYFFLFYIYKNIKDNKKIIKGSLIILTTLLLDFIIARVSITPKIEMIDVGQGDSFLVRDGKYNILIDTGPSDKYDTTINYLRSLNINYLDAVFISHYDSDHYGNMDNIKSSIKINETINPIDNKYYKYGNITIRTIKYDMSDDNNSSMILYMVVNNIKILFTGDIEEEVEELIIKKYNLKVDILKVAHHGSSSSSTMDFIKETNPKISLISVGLNNRYNHPSSEVIERLNSINTHIYRTDIDGSVKIYLVGKIYIIKKYKSSNIKFIDNLKNLSLII